MYLKALEIQGFKSFADKTVLCFGDDITSIVGPNGSGKSNISDAISWVMGEMSSKALRGSKMEDVIFGGTQKRGQMGFAEASLILDNSDGVLPVETAEVTVTRRYYRSGESEYFINRQAARLRDIHEMFMDTGLGKEGYSNIGQGKIDEILALKSTDRREVFEEAAGISKYRHRKEETERRLAATDNNLMRINDKISELEGQVEPLRQQAEKAEKYLKLREELKGVEVALWMSSLEKLAQAYKKAEQDFASAAFILEQQHGELTRLYQLSEQLTMQLNQKNLEIDRRRETISSIEGQIHQQESEETVLKSGIEHAQDNIVRIRKELTDQEDRSGSIAAQIARQEEHIRQLAQRLDQIGKELTAAVGHSKELEAADAEVENRIRQIREAQAMLQTQSAGKQAEAKALTASMEELWTRKQSIREDIDIAEHRHTQLLQQVSEYERELEHARETVESCSNAEAGYVLRQKSRGDRRDKLQKETEDLRIQLKTICSRIRMLQEMQRDYDGFHKAVRLVMQEAGRNTLGRIYGPVSSLIQTEDIYTVAVETALGAGMQNIVVDSEEDGKLAIRFLKQCDGGRATFLPVSTVRGKTIQERELDHCPGFVGIASELVSFAPAFRGVVESLLGKIVLVETLNHAVSMARKYQNRFKIVTLDGQVIHAGGSMTGGSASKSAGILSRSNELVRLQQQKKSLENRLQVQEGQLAEAVRSAAQAEFELTAVHGQLRQAQDEVLRVEGRLQQAQALQEAVAQNIAGYRRELAIMENRTDGDDSRLNLLREQIKASEDQLAEQQQQLETLTKEQQQLTAQAEQWNEQITSLRLEAAAQEAERITAQENVCRFHALEEAMAGDKGQKQQLIADYETQIQQLQLQLQHTQQKRQSLQQQWQEDRQMLQQTIEDRSATEARRTKTEKQAQEKNREILDMEREAARLEQKKNSVQMEEKQILDKLWDNYQLTPSTAGTLAVPMESAAAAGKQIADLKRKISALGTPNLGAIEEYTRVNERYRYLTDQRDDVAHGKRELEQIIKAITAEMTEIFQREFSKINEYFGKTFEEMFGGGRGELVLEDPMAPLECGIEIKVQPPGKQLKTITLLSGGEKAFVAIALYFAILKVRPTPFCLLDEIDAALDDRNVERFAAYLRTLCRNTQFIVITHRRGTMEASDILYGVTMQEQGISKILHLDLNQMAVQLGIAE